MNVSELTINDWVSLDGEPIQVAGLQGRKVGVHKRRRSIYCSWHLDSEFQPIRLTSEILEKNGLQKLNDKKFLIKNQIEIEVGTKFSEVSARYEDYDRDYNSYNNRYIEIAIIHYVHELQHLLRLIGVEKEIEL